MNDELFLLDDFSNTDFGPPIIDILLDEDNISIMKNELTQGGSKNGTQ